MFNKNLALAMLMFSIFGDEVAVDHNEQQDLVTLTNPNEDCYVTITKAQYDTLFAMLGDVDEIADQEVLDDNMNLQAETYDNSEL